MYACTSCDIRTQWINTFETCASDKDLCGESLKDVPRICGASTRVTTKSENSSYSADLSATFSCVSW